MKNNFAPKIKVAIRDDDLSFYSKVKDLDFLYGTYFGKIPISFGVVPFICKFALAEFHQKGRDKYINLGDQKFDISLNKMLDFRSGTKSQTERGDHETRATQEVG